MPRRGGMYLYAITDRHDRPSLTLHGLDDAPVRSVHTASLSAVVSAVAEANPAPTPMRLWQHERVVETCMRQGAVLPAPFALTLPSDTDLEALLDERSETYAHALDRLRDCVEVNVRILRMMPPVPVRSLLDDPPLPCLRPSERQDPACIMARRAILQQDACRRRRDDSLVEMVHRVLEPLAIDYHLKREVGGATLCSVAYLLEKDKVDHFASTLWTVTARHPSLHTLCTGPWPPYHFANPLL